MPLVDVILLLIIFAFVFFGFFFGLIHTIGNLVGIVLGLVISSYYIDPLSQSFGFLFGGGGTGRVVLFVILFFIVSRVIGLVFWVLEKVFGVVTWLPFASSLNRLLGAVFGFVEGVIVLGIVLYYAMQYLPDAALRTALETSNFANFLVATMTAIQVFFPESFRAVR